MNTTSPYKLCAVGDKAIMVIFGNKINLKTNAKVMRLASYLDLHPMPGTIEYVPAYTSVTIYYDPVVIINTTNEEQLPYEIIKQSLISILDHLDDEIVQKKPCVEIPVCYEEKFSPDLKFVADYNSLSLEEVVYIHTHQIYHVYMLGFAPGFPYLGGMSKKIAAPRKKSPALVVPAGSVGIADTQTGIYPIQTPGGWQIIGRTPLQLFQPDKDPPTLLKAGNKIIFKPISIIQFEVLKEASY